MAQEVSRVYPTPACFPRPLGVKFLHGDFAFSGYARWSRMLPASVGMSYSMAEVCDNI